MPLLPSARGTIPVPRGHPTSSPMALRGDQLAWAGQSQSRGCLSQVPGTAHGWPLTLPTAGPWTLCLQPRLLSGAAEPSAPLPRRFSLTFPSSGTLLPKPETNGKILTCSLTSPPPASGHSLSLGICPLFSGSLTLPSPLVQATSRHGLGSCNLPAPRLPGQPPPPRLLSTLLPWWSVTSELPLAPCCYDTTCMS